MHLVQRSLARTGAAPLAASLFVGSAVVGQSPDSSPATGGTGAVDGTGTTITLVSGVQNNPYFASMECGARVAGRDTGATIDIQAPAQFDANLQNQVIQAAAAVAPDGLVIDAVFAVEAAPIVQEIIDAGIPVSIIEEPLETNGQVATLMSDQVAMGRMAAETLFERIGDAGKVYVIDFQAGVPSTDGRLTGFKEVLADHPNIEFVGSDYTGDDPAAAAQVFSGVHQAHPDLKGVWGTNLYGVQGVITALEEAGLSEQVTVMAPDTLPNEIDWLREGSVYALVGQKPYELGYQGVTSILENLAGTREKSDERVVIADPFVLVTQDNIDDPEVSKYFNSFDCEVSA
jgi:ribose transport system substrate-binding protein